MSFSLFYPSKPQLHQKKPHFPSFQKGQFQKSNFYQFSPQDFGFPNPPSQKAALFEKMRNNIKYKITQNDGSKQSLLYLTLARNLFHQEISDMPQHYMMKLVFNYHHLTFMVFNEKELSGSICFRPFFEQNFVEIAFCAVSSIQKVSGIGTYLMALLKKYCQSVGIHHLLTYADNTAIVFFKGRFFR
jgi:hypothetical protein